MGKNQGSHFTKRKQARKNSFAGPYDLLELPEAPEKPNVCSADLEAANEIYKKNLLSSAEKAFQADVEQAINIAQNSHEKRIKKDAKYFLNRLHDERNRLNRLAEEATLFANKYNKMRGVSKRSLDFARTTAVKTRLFLNEKLMAFERLCKLNHETKRPSNTIRSTRAELQAQWQKLCLDMRDLDTEYDILADLREQVQQPATNLQKNSSKHSVDNEEQLLNATKSFDKCASHFSWSTTRRPNSPTPISDACKIMANSMLVGLSSNELSNIADANIRNSFDLPNVRNKVYHFKEYLSSEDEDFADNANDGQRCSINHNDIDVVSIIAQRRGIGKEIVSQSFVPNSESDFTIVKPIASVCKISSTMEMKPKGKTSMEIKQTIVHPEFTSKQDQSTDEESIVSQKKQENIMDRVIRQRRLMQQNTNAHKHNRIDVGNEMHATNKKLNARLVAGRELQWDMKPKVKNQKPKSMDGIDFPAPDKSVHVFIDMNELEGDVPQTKLIATNEAKNASFFLKRIREEKDRLSLAAEEIAIYINYPRKFPQISVEVLCILRLATETTQRLLTNRLAKFEALCNDSLEKDKKDMAKSNMRPEELLAYWDLLQIEIADIDELFEQIKILQQNNWRHSHVKGSAAANTTLKNIKKKNKN